MKTTIESSSRTLVERAQLLQRLLTEDGFELSLEDAEQLLLADLVEQIKVKSFV